MSLCTLRATSSRGSSVRPWMEATAVRRAACDARRALRHGRGGDRGYGLTDIACHVIQYILKPLLLTQIISYDVASNSLYAWP